VWSSSTCAERGAGISGLDYSVNVQASEHLTDIDNAGVGSKKKRAED